MAAAEFLHSDGVWCLEWLYVLPVPRSRELWAGSAMKRHCRLSLSCCTDSRR